MPGGRATARRIRPGPGGAVEGYALGLGVRFRVLGSGPSRFI